VTGSFKRKYEPSATKMEFVVTKTTELATDVNSSELIQKIKCSAKQTPPSSA
jgi:hypothetical protein